jgi:phosphatidate cytidylyltransferase
MSEADPARSVDTTSSGRGELALRVISSLVLAPLAIFVAYLGGWTLAAFWGVAAILVFWEWTGLVLDGDRRAVRLAGFMSVALAVVCAAASGQAIGDMHGNLVLAAFASLFIGIFATASLAPRLQRIWVSSGVPYAGMIAVAPVLLRADGDFGFMTLMFLYAIVWATDILAYLVGRAIGGPKVAPRISPKKTWSGAIGGAAAAVAAAVAIAWSGGLAGVGKIVLLAAVLSAVAQAGDFFESALKRRFGAKDSGHLIPGHGGLMDRLDGFVVAAALALVIGIVRGGLHEPARGLLVW